MTSRRNPSTRRKSFPNTDDTRFLSFWRNVNGNTRKIDALVTTHQLFRPNEQRKPEFLLPIRLPNPLFSEGPARHDTPRGGGERRTAAKIALGISSHRNFIVKGLPCPTPIAQKKWEPDQSAFPLQHRKSNASHSTLARRSHNLFCEH